MPHQGNQPSHTDHPDAVGRFDALREQAPSPEVQEVTMSDLEGITAISGPSAENLNDRQLLDYRRHREDCLEWLLTFGLDPELVEGYAHATVANRGARMDQFYRWVWATNDGYTVDITHDHADAYMEEFATRDNSNAHKASCLKAIQMLMKWSITSAAVIPGTCRSD